MTPQHQTLLASTTTIVVAAVERSMLPRNDISAFIKEVFTTLSALDSAQKIDEPAPVPAVNPKNSVRPDYIVCLEDGKRFKSLKRHLMSTFKLTPEQYRRKWGLADSYPMVAPEYASQRSALAKQMGLGRKRGAARG